MFKKNGYTIKLVAGIQSIKYPFSVVYGNCQKLKIDENGWRWFPGLLV